MLYICGCFYSHIFCVVTYQSPSLVYHIVIILFLLFCWAQVLNVSNSRHIAKFRLLRQDWRSLMLADILVFCVKPYLFQRNIICLSCMHLCYCPFAQLLDIYSTCRLSQICHSHRFSALHFARRSLPAYNVCNFQPSIYVRSCVITHS